MGEVLRLSEIKTRFDSEWVLIEDPQLDQSLEVIGGKVLRYGKDRDEVYQKALELRPKHSAFLFIGSLPQDAAIGL